MKKKISFIILLAFLIGFSPFLSVTAQTYTVTGSPTSKPYYQSLSNGWVGYTQDTDVWIKLSATVSGSKITFTATKSSGTFKNSIVANLKEDVVISGKTVTSQGTFIDSKMESAGSSSASITYYPTFSSGSHTYRVILSSGSIMFYTDAITVTANGGSTKLATPDYTTFSATNISTSSFTAKWGSVSGATKYGILVRSSSGTYEDPVFSKEVSSTSCSVTGLQPGTSYYFQIQARNGNSSQNSTWSKSIANAVTTTEETKLATPDYTTFYASDISTTSFVAHWGKVSGATQYYVNIREVGGQYPSSPTGGSTGTSYKFENLKPGTSYEFQVRAINDSQKSDWSRSIANAVTTTEETKLATPNYTTFSAANISTTSFTAKWGSVSGATKYGILVRSSSGTYENPVFSSEVSSTYCNVTGLQPGTSYYFQIQARNGNSSQNSTWSKSIANAVTTTEETKLATPDYTTFYASDISTTSFVAHWGKVSGATQYYVNIREVGGQYPSSPTGGSTGTSYKFENLKPGTSYEFQVRAINNSQKSDWSRSIANAVTTLTSTTTFSAPFNPNPADNANNVATSGKLSWNCTGAGSNVLYTIFLGTSTSNWKSYASYSKTYNYSNLTEGVPYYWKVKATDGTTTTESPTWKFTTKTSSTPEAPKLVLYKVKGFDGSIPLTVNKTYHYSVLVLNNGSSTWQGSFYLKDGKTDVKPWYGISLTKGVAQPLEFDYTPNESGKKSFVLYYQTGGKGDGVPVPTTSNKDNIMNVTVVEEKTAPTYNLMLNNSITCPSSINWGNNTTISANVVNNSSDKWTGTLYLTDNGRAIQTENTTLSVGEKFTIKCNSWSPTTADRHAISVYYKTEGDSDWKQISANGYTVPTYISVANVNVATTAQNAVLTLITKGCAPTYVNEGDQVFYYYRITDNNGKPLQGMKARFNCSGSSLKSTFETTASDLEGYAILCLETSGNNAFANRGETGKFVCSGFIDSNNNSVGLSNSNSDDISFSLCIYKGVNHFTEGIESFAITIDRGVTGEAKLASFASASASLSFPLTTTLKWANNQLLTQIDSEMKGELKGSISFKDLIGGSVGGEVGIKESTTYNWSNPKKTSIAVLMSLFDATQLFTSSHTMRSIMAIESWFGIKKDGFYDGILEDYRQSSLWALSLGLNYNANAIKYWPITYGVNPGTLFPDLKIPLDQSQLNGKFSGEASFKCEPEIARRDFGSSKDQYGISRQLKAKINVDINKVFNTLSPATGTLLDPIPEKNLATYVGQYERNFNKSWGGGASVVLSTKEEEMYTSKSRQTLGKISNSLEAEAAFKISTSSLKEYLCPEWSNANEGKSTVSMGGSIALKWKMTSAGDFAKDLQTISKYTPKISSSLYPALDHKNSQYIIEAPQTYWNMMKGNYFENALRFVTSQYIFTGKNYNVKEAFKIETQETDKAYIKASLPLLKWGIIDVTLDCGLSFDVSYYPSETYYSVSNKRLCPVVLRNNITLASLVKKGTEYLKTKFNEAFGIEDKEEINTHAGKAFDIQESKLNSMIKELSNKNKPHGGGGGTSWVKRRAPRLIGIKQDDICTFTFTINDQTQNFDEGTNITSTHFYPMGKLLGITDQNDTLFVVSEVFDLEAVYGTDTLQTTKNGKIKLDTHVGADDLTPFGLSADTPMAVYQADPSSGDDNWKYVGPAGTTLLVDRMGCYMMATSIKNDLTAPEIAVDLYDETGILHFNVTDNIAIKTNSFKVYVNNELKDAVMLNESTFEVILTPEDMKYRLNVNVSVYDLAGNKCEIYQIFQITKQEKPIDQSLEPDTDISQLENVIYISQQNVKPGEEATISVNMKNSVPVEGFSFDLTLPEGISFVTDGDGFPEVELSTQRTTKRKTSTFEEAILPNGNLRVLAASTNGYTFSGNDGEVALVKVKVDENMMSGTYPLILTEISLSDSDAQSYDTEYVKSSIKVSSGLKADVNQDGKVDISDIVAVINTIAGDSTYRSTADVNDDSNIDISDIVAIINHIAGM